MGANIAEGCGKQGNNELHRFLYIASGSASELDYHLLLARDLCYLTDENYRRMDQNLHEARRMLTALLQKVGVDRFAANC
jgi:four helix bundle protein